MKGLILNEKLESLYNCPRRQKKATIDGSTMAARNDDTFLPLTPQRFVTYPSVSDRHETLTSGQNGFTAPLPESGYRYQGTPNVDVEHEGVYDENGFNEKKRRYECY